MDCGTDDSAQATAGDISNLGAAEWLLLWAIRYWVACNLNERSPWPLIGEVFDRNRAEDAAASLDALLRLTSLTARLRVDVRCPACPQLSFDERHMIDAVAIAQRGRKADASRMLRTWLPRGAARMGLTMVTGLAGILAEAGHHLPAPDTKAAGKTTTSIVDLRLQPTTVH